MGGAFPDTLWGPEAQGGMPSACQLVFIASQIRQAYKGSRPALGAGNPSPKSPQNAQRNPRASVHPGTQTWMVGEKQDKQAVPRGSQAGQGR